MRKCKTIGKIAAVLLVMGILLPFFKRENAGAAFEQLVRVGYYESEGLQKGDSDADPKSGYAYEYMRRIASYTGWRYEYEYGSFEELRYKLESGEIDLLMVPESDGLIDQKSIEHSDSSFFSDTINIYKKRGNSDILNGYISSLYSRNIGVLEDSLYYTRLMNFITQYGFTCRVQLFNDNASMYEALMNDQIELLVVPEHGDIDFSKISPVLEIGDEEYYFCVSNKQRLLAREMNRAMVSIDNETPYFTRELTAKYSLKNKSGFEHSEDEIKWFSNHKSIRIGFLDDYMPYSSYEDEEKQRVTGLIKDIVERISASTADYNLKIETLGYADLLSMITALKNGDIDAIFPIYQNEWYSELNGFRISDAVVEPNVVMLFSGRYEEDKLKRVAVAGDNPLQDPISVLYYPESERVSFSSLDECAEAIGKNDMFTLMDRYKANEYIKLYGERNISLIPINEDIFFSFAVRNSETGLLSVLNHIIRDLNVSDVNLALQSYSYVEKRASFKDLVQDNSLTFVMTAFAVITLISAGFILYIVSNVKRRKEMEASQRAISEAKQQVEDALSLAQQASEAKSSFLFNMSHDIRTPMNAIIGFAELIERKKLSAEKSAEYITNIKKAGKYLLELINEVLEMARIENGKIVLDESVSDLVSLSEDVRMIIESRYREKELTVTRDIKIKNKNCYCDEVKLKAIIINILGNAIKYTPKGGSIDIKVHELEAAKEGYAKLELCISDTGIGMSKEFVPHIFESFSRERNATESKIVGTGLGMGIVKKYVDLMQGSIDVDSELGKGTAVTLTLELRLAEEEKADDNSEAIIEGKAFAGMRILLAEDNEMNREIAEEILSEYGFLVETAVDGVECISKIMQKPSDYYQLILMDVQMPNMNGWDTTRAIRKLDDKVKAGIPVIALTANVFDSDRKQAFEIGMNGFIGKPIVIPSLVEEIARVKAAEN